MKTPQAKKNPKPEKEQQFRSERFLAGVTGQAFREWWKNHRHSGYATRLRGGIQDVHWGILPQAACNCDRYMAEFASDNNLDERLAFDYSAEDYERWALEKKVATDAVVAFAAAYDGREIPTTEEFSATLKSCVRKLVRASSPERRPFKPSAQ